MGIEDDIARADEPAYVRELEALAALVELKQESDKRKAELERLGALVEIHRARYEAEVARLKAELLQLNNFAADKTVRLRRLAGEQVQTLKALRGLVDVVKLIGDSNVPDRFLAALHLKLREAAEVIALLDVPFG